MNDRFLKQIHINWEKIGDNDYLREIPALNSIDTISFDSNITFFVGENGTGKSTLLEGIAVAYGFSAEGGNKNYNFSTFDSHSSLYDAITLVRGVRRPKNSYFLRAESFYNVASKSEEYRDGDPIESFYESYGGKSLHQLSHGESFLALVQGNFKEEGFYILDEPEAALSPQRQLTLLIEMERLAKKGAQFIVASHSPILLGIPDASLLSFDNEKIHPCQYVDTSSYQVMEMFINHREGFLRHLFANDYLE